MKIQAFKILALMSFLTVSVSTDNNMQSQQEITEPANYIVDTQQLEESHSYFRIIYPRKYYDAEQEEIRNEIYYGELEEIALIVQAEAGNQDELGKRYVADVIFNRIDSKDFPDTALDVIYQTNPVQFSTTVDGAMGKAGYEISEEVFQIVLEEAENRTNYDIIYFKTGGYHECGTPAFEHGDHYFSTK